jgi:hypothetical protein
VPVYRFYTSDLGESAGHCALLPDDRAAVVRAYGFMDTGASVDVWEQMRHVAHLWGEVARERPPAPGLRLVSAAELQDG